MEVLPFISPPVYPCIHPSIHPSHMPSVHWFTQNIPSPHIFPNAPPVHLPDIHPSTVHQHLLPICPLSQSIHPLIPPPTHLLLSIFSVLPLSTYSIHHSSISTLPLFYPPFIHHLPQTLHPPIHPQYSLPASNGGMSPVRSWWRRGALGNSALITSGAGAGAAGGEGRGAHRDTRSPFSLEPV